MGGGGGGGEEEFHSLVHSHQIREGNAGYFPFQASGAPLVFQFLPGLGMARWAWPGRGAQVPSQLGPRPAPSRAGRPLQLPRHAPSPCQGGLALFVFQVL